MSEIRAGYVEIFEQSSHTVAQPLTASCNPYRHVIFHNNACMEFEWRMRYFRQLKMGHVFVPM